MAAGEQELTCRGAALRLGLAEATVRRLLRQGRLPGRKASDGWRVRAADCDAWLAARRETRVRRVDAPLACHCGEG